MVRSTTSPGWAPIVEAGDDGGGLARRPSPLSAAASSALLPSTSLLAVACVGSSAVASLLSSLTRHLLALRRWPRLVAVVSRGRGDRAGGAAGWCPAPWASRPVIWWVGVAAGRRASAARAAATRLTPSLEFWICSCSVRIALSSISGRGGQPGQVDVDRDDVVDALHDGVVVEHAAGAGADTHRDDPLGLGHLVVDLAHDRRHLLAHPAGDDHQVGLARRGGEPLHAEPRDVVVGRADGHHLDGAAGQAERGRPDRALAHVAGDLLDRASAGSLRAASLRFPLLVLVLVSPTRGRRGATRMRRPRTRSG